LIDCMHHIRARHTLVRALGRKATSIQHLLTDPDATAHLVSFVNSTGRFRPTLGEISLPRSAPN
jgi:hypothetical protein